jgi:effector-binding domain-containing protein
VAVANLPRRAGELESFIAGSIRDLTARADPAGPPFVIYHDAVNDETDGRVEVCLPTGEAVEGGGELPAGPVAYAVAEGSQTNYPEILGAYDAVADWVKRHGHELAGPPREIRHRHDGEASRMEIAWPIR